MKISAVLKLIEGDGWQWGFARERDNMISYLIIIEGDGSTNYSAYCPDLPGVAATGHSIDECAAEMRDAIAFHIEGLHDAGEPVPPSTSRGRTVEVAA